MREAKVILTAALTGLFGLAGCTDREGVTTPSINPSITSSTTNNTYGAEATVVRAVVPATGTDVTLVKAGPIPPSGGTDEEQLASAQVPGLLSATLLSAKAAGSGPSSRAQAWLADLTLTVAGNTISANVVRAFAEASCRPDSVALFGMSHITKLVINGQATTVSGAPNQTIDLAVGKVVINEQTTTANGITTNALHVDIPGVADVIISSAHADITCGVA